MMKMKTLNLLLPGEDGELRVAAICTPIGVPENLSLEIIAEILNAHKDKMRFEYSEIIMHNNDER